MIAGQRAQQQASQLVADRLVEAEHGRRTPLLDPVQSSAMLEDESESTAGLGSGGFHQLQYRRRPAAR